MFVNSLQNLIKWILVNTWTEILTDGSAICCCQIKNKKTDTGKETIPVIKYVNPCTMHICGMDFSSLASYWQIKALLMLEPSVAECDIRENVDTNECLNIFVSTKLHEWISEYIHTNFFDTNECPNIFVSTKWHEWISEYIHINLFDTNECPIKYSYWKLHEYSNIFEYSSRFYTLTHLPTNVWIYLYKQIWYERMSEYIRKKKIDSNECPNIYSWPIYSNIRIFEYIRHTLFQTDPL